jgi:adenylate cyclase
VQIDGSDRGSVPAAPSGERRIAAVVAADVVGYTRLMEADEAGTHARLMRLRSSVVLPAIERHRGRLIKNTGDGFLAMFEDASAAMHAATEMQRAVMAAEAEVALGQRIAFRMGINVAEVIVEDHDVYGDGVNVAARLQTHAEPYGIVVSGLVSEAVGGTLGMQAVDLGQMYLRNREHPVRVLSLRFSDAPTASLGEAEPGSEGRPTIAVLPFRKIAAGDDAYFADGIVDNIIHSLAALKDLFVIARGSTLGFGGGEIDVRAIGRALGVRYLLYGSAQKIGNRVRIGTELLDAETAATVATDQYNGSFEDIFELQDRIAAHVVKAIAPRVRESELRRAMRKHPQNMTAYDLVLQALELLYRFDYASFSRARGLLQRAIVSDPTYAPAYSHAARWHSIRIGQGWTTNIVSDSEEAIRLAEKAIKCDSLDPLALSIYGHIQSYLYKNYEVALHSFERALAASPNSDLAWTLGSATYGYLGDGPEAVKRAETGLRLSPIDLRIYFAQHILSQAHFINGRYQSAEIWGERSENGNSQLTSNLRVLAATKVALRKFEDARRIADRHRILEPTFSLSIWAQRTPLQGGIRDYMVQLLEVAGFPH